MEMKWIYIALLGAGCQPKVDDATLGKQIAEGIIAACPMADPGDEQARANCAQKLSDLAVLRDALGEGMVWGGQVAAGYRLDKKTTRFNPYVWRRLYLSTEMFDGTYTVDPPVGGYTVIHLPNHFRNKLDMGSYPYPFWHSKSKWDSYQLSKEVLLILKDGTIEGGLRSSDQDMMRNHVDYTWDGQWYWEKGGSPQPYDALFTYLFTKDNPYTAKLDQTYRVFEAQAREESCTVCHSPNNASNMDQLVLISYPNQTLWARHRIIEQLEANLMPPDNDAGIAKGLADGPRQRLIDLARDFASVGDQALAWEGELKIDDQPRPPGTGK
jgi:hypothetical protein